MSICRNEYLTNRRALARLVDMTNATQTIYSLTAEARFFFPVVGPSILVKVDSRRGAWKMAPLTKNDAGETVRDLAAAFECFPEDLQELR